MKTVPGYGIEVRKGGREGEGEMKTVPGYGIALRKGGRVGEGEMKTVPGNGIEGLLPCHVYLIESKYNLKP